MSKHIDPAATTAEIGIAGFDAREIVTDHGTIFIREGGPMQDAAVRGTDRR